MVDRGLRRDSGITYVEVVLCIAVTTVFLASLFTARARDFRFLGDSLDEARAERAAAARLETLLARRETAAPGTRTLALPPGFEDALPGGRLEETVREAGPGLLAVEVRVRWRIAGSEDRTFTVTTLVAAEERR
jgi:hypothetical protein